MPYQPRNFGTELLKSPWEQDFGKLLEQGMLLRHEPQRLMREKEKELLNNALQKEKVGQAQIESQYYPENQKYLANMNRVKSEYAQPTAEQELTKATQYNEWQPKLNASQMEYQGANAAKAREETKLMPGKYAQDAEYKKAMIAAKYMQAASPKSPLGKLQSDYDNAVKEEGGNSPRALTLKKAIDAAAESAGMKGLTQTEKEALILKNKYEKLKDPNISPEEKSNLKREVTTLENKLEKAATTPKIRAQKEAGLPLQQTIKKMLTKRKSGKDMIDDLTYYSGKGGAALKKYDAFWGSPEYTRYQDAETQMHILNGQFTTFNKFSVGEKAEESRLKNFNPSQWGLSPKEAARLSRNALNTVTEEHQVVADTPRKEAGLPRHPIDVMGGRRDLADKDIPEINF